MDAHSPPAISNASQAIANRQTLLAQLPWFTQLSPPLLQDLAARMTVERYRRKQTVVKEGEVGRCIYIIVQGIAEVFKQKNGVNELVASLYAGELIGVGKKTLLPTHWQRNATVKAATPLILLRLDVEAYNDFITRYPQVKTAMQAIIAEIALRNFIKATNQFGYFKDEQIREVMKCLQSFTPNMQEVIIREGDMGDTCYFIRRGKVKVTTQDQTGAEHLLAILEEGEVFGELALLSATRRNATVTTLEPCELLVLRREDLERVLAKDRAATQALLNLQLYRSRPKALAQVEYYHRTTLSGQVITILKNNNLKNPRYYQLPPEGWFIWQHLDGQHTLEELTVKFFTKFQVFAPELIANALFDLTEAGFITASGLEWAHATGPQPFLKRALRALRAVMEAQLAITGIDELLLKIYQHSIRRLYTAPAQILLLGVIILGLLVFVMNAAPAAGILAASEHKLLYFLLLIPIRLIAATLHELGHAFTTLAFGRRIYRMGIGWYWVGPIAFVDTSDIWLGTRRQRIIVSLAGMYVDAITAGLAALAALALAGTPLATLLWLFALINYIGIYLNLNPLFEYDGYFVLLDLFGKANLRLNAVKCLFTASPHNMLRARWWRHHRAELNYWLACAVFLLFTGWLSLQLYEIFLKNLLPYYQDLWYLRWGFFLLMAIISFASVASEIRRKTH